MFRLFFIAFVTFCQCFTLPEVKLENRKPSSYSVDVSNETCKTEACISAANNLRLSIDITADPCDDFYSYACGLWSQLNPIPDEAGSISTFGKLAGRISWELKNMLNTMDPGKYKERSIKLLYDMYNKCLDENAIEVASDTPLKTHIANVFGPMHHEHGRTLITRASSASSKQLESLLATLWMQHGIDALISTYLEADMMDNSKHMLTLDQAPLGLGYKSEDYYAQPGETYQEVRDAYLNMMENVSAVLWNADGSPQPTRQQTKDAEKILDFEIELARINKPADERRDPIAMYNKMPLDELYTLGGQFDLAKYLANFNVDHEVNVAEPTYITKLNQLLKKTDPDVVKGYLLWKFILANLPYLARNVSDNYYRFTKVYYGRSRNSDRSMYCVNYVMGKIGDDQEGLGYALGRLFIDLKNFTSDAKHHMNEMVDELFISFKKLLDSNDWMDDVTKEKARMKIETMISNVGYPDMIVNDIDSFYTPLLEPHADYYGTQMNPSDSFYTMNNKLMAWTAQKQNKKISEPYDRETFAGSPAIVNAWFYPTKNSITFPAGILQRPFYDVNYPSALNFGAMGCVIGHEITHGFDDQGSQFDGYGNLADWWTEASKKQFDEKAQCIIDQYSGYCYPHLGDGVCVKGIETQGENIADNGGLIQGFYAYQNYMKGKKELVLPSFEKFTPEQLFFLSYANFECSNYRDGALANRISTNEHAPGRDRVIGPFQNFKEFSKAFNCPVGSRMNPVHKCAVW